MMTTVYLVVTADEYELPVLCAEDVEEIVEHFGGTKSSVFSTITRNSKFRRKYRIHKVEIEEDEEPIKEPVVHKRGGQPKKELIDQVKSYIAKLEKRGKKISVRQACMIHDVSPKTYRKWVSRASVA